MGKQSTRENKTIYQLCREEKELTREKASELMAGVSSSRIEKIEYETQEPTPYDVVQMADCYKRPDLCNYYCSINAPSGSATFRKWKSTNSPILSWRQLPVSMKSIHSPAD